MGGCCFYQDAKPQRLLRYRYHSVPAGEGGRVPLYQGDGENFQRNLCPAYLEDGSEVHETEPYVYSQTVTGRASGEPGHAKNSWLTGTASWTFVSISQAILGIQPDCDGLKIVPCLPDELKELTVRRQFRGAVYGICIRQTGARSVTVNGQTVEGSTVPLFPAGSRVQVEITL